MKVLLKIFIILMLISCETTIVKEYKVIQVYEEEHKFDPDGTTVLEDTTTKVRSLRCGRLGTPDEIIKLREVKF